MSWPLVKLGDVAPAKASKHVFSTSDEVWTLNLDQVEADTGNLLRKVMAPVSEAGTSTHGFDERHVLYSKLRPYLNKVVLPDEKGLATTELVPMLPDPLRLDRKYLAYYLRSKSFVDWVSSQVAGAKMPRVSMQLFWQHEMPLPPLPEQKRIAAILDKADSIRRKRQQTIQLADDFIRAVFLDMFGDPVTNPKGWNLRPVKEMAKVTTGNTPPRDKLEYYGDFIEWIKSDNINSPSDFLTVATEYLSEAGCMVGRRVPTGSTLLTCIAGSFDCIGNAAYADREVSFNQQINALTPRPGVNGIFLYALSKYCKKAIQAASTGGMKGMISKGKLEEVRFICPPESMQQKFAEAFRRHQDLRKRMGNSQDGLSDEFSSISQKAFSGHL